MRGVVSSACQILPALSHIITAGLDRIGRSPTFASREYWRTENGYNYTIISLSVLRAEANTNILHVQAAEYGKR